MVLGEVELGEMGFDETGTRQDGTWRTGTESPPPYTNNFFLNQMCKTTFLSDAKCIN